MCDAQFLSDLACDPVQQSAYLLKDVANNVGFLRAGSVWVA